MPRIPRLVVPDYPHHVTQRGNRRQKTFFHTHDYLAYLELIAAAKTKAGCDIWAYCLMPNHVHFVIVPEHESSLAVLIKEAHANGQTPGKWKLHRYTGITDRTITETP
jgi:putative transposase